jgi:chloramphenicol-sensitive protein RarD
MTSQQESPASEAERQQSRDGLISALIAYIFWGLLPIYFIFVKDVDSFEVLVHRVIWAVPFGALIIHFRDQWAEVWRAFTHPRMFAYLSISAVLIAGNWLVYIIAVQQEQIFQASLGYYINPLIFSIAGVYLFGETLSRPQVIAVSLAAVGVVILTVSGGSFPAIAIFLGISFTIYGVIRKKVVIGGMPGLFVETLVLFPFALVYLIWIMISGTAVFSSAQPGMAIALALAGPLTVIPLLFFALAARRLKLSTVGMMQFLAPSLQFLVGVIYGEQLTLPHIICFACIWTAVALFSWDALRRQDRR